MCIRDSRGSLAQRLRSGAGACRRFPELSRTPRRGDVMSKMRIATLGAIGALLALPALAQGVKVMPLGGVDGEFCILDRALVFEDPSGTRILYDPGFTVAGPGDPRLGKIDIILVS